MPLPNLKNLPLLVLLFATLTLLAILLPGKAAQRQQAVARSTGRRVTIDLLDSL